MKTFLLTVALCAAVSYAAPQNKREVSHLVRSQDINNKYIPVQQYNQEYQQQQPNNQYLDPAVRSSQAERQNYQLPETRYSVPNHQEHQQQESNNQYPDPAVRSSQVARQNYQLPATRYGVPDQAAPAPVPAPIRRSSIQAAAPGLVTSYGTPVVNDGVAVRSTHVQHTPQVYQAPVAVSHQTYSTPVVHTTSVHQTQVPVVHRAPLPVVHQAQVPVVHQAPVQVVHQAPVTVAHQAPLPVVHQAPLPALHSAPLAHQTTTVVHQAPESIFSPEVKIHTEDKYYIIQRSAPVVHTAPVVHQEIHHPAPIVDLAPESIFSPISQVEHGWNLEGNFDFQAPTQLVDGFENLDDQRIPSVPIAPAPIAEAPAPIENVQDDAVVVDAVGRSANVGTQFNQAQVRSGAGYVY